MARIIMKIVGCLPFILLLTFRIPSSVSEPCDGFMEKPFFEKNAPGFIFLKENEIEFMNFCSAQNYCSIEWFKDGQLLEPSKNFTDGHLVVRDDGRMLRFSAVLDSDAANYTCIARNNAGSIRRTQELFVKARRTCPRFISTSHKASDRIVDIGGSHFEKWSINTTNADLFCSFEKEIIVNNTSDRMDCGCGKCYKDSTRPDIWYAEINLTNMREDDFGTYRITVNEDHFTCKAIMAEINLTQNKTSAVEVKSTAVVSTIGLFILVFMLCVVTWQIIKVDIQLFVKDYLYKSEADDGKSYDAYISYTWTDIDRLFVLQLKSHLEKRGYSVYVPEIDNTAGGCTVLQLTEALQQSRRFVMVLSPDYIRANFTSFEVNVVIEAVNQYKDVIIPVVFQGSLSPDESAILRHILKVGQTVTWTKIEWPLSENSTYEDEPSLEALVVENSKNSQTFMERSFRTRGYKQLLLRLPPKPKRTGNKFYLLD